MTVRFSEGEIRFRVVPSELEVMIAGGALTLDSIPLKAEVRARDISGTEKLFLKVEGAHLLVEVSKKELELLKSRLPSREGIDEVIKFESGIELSVSFEVDIKAKQRNS